MSELRKNPLTGEWVILAENRSKRPYDFLREAKPKEREACSCPFCHGNEDKTTAPVYQDGEDGKWSIRVFPNRFPAVSFEDEPKLEMGFFENYPGIGEHEVLVDTPSHTQTIDDFSEEHMRKVIQVLWQRFQIIREKKEVRYVQIFKNCGADAGMSLQHSHWQLIGVPIISHREEAALYFSRGYKKDNGTCLFCDMLAYEQKAKKRVVRENDSFVAFTPYASKFSYELWIGAKRHIATFSEMTEAELNHLSQMLLWSLEQVRQIRKDISYNICFMDAPKGVEGEFHWYIQILPRIGGFAGFEYATQTYINSVSPEQAAQFYRGEQ